MMSSANIQKVKENHFKLAGPMNFFTIMPIYNTSLPLLAQSTAFHFDFSEVTECNSACLALLLEWVKIATRDKKAISFNKLPTEITAIARIAGVDKLITQ